MRIGIDFDNTIARYDKLFIKIALAKPYPTLNPASPCALEKVRRVITLSYL